VTPYGFKHTHLQVCSVAYPILEAVDELPAREPYGGGYFGMIGEAKHSRLRVGLVPNECPGWANCDVE
jgi:hypothetical protein